MNKKAAVGIIIILVIICLIFLIAYIVEIAQHECSKNSQCSAKAYCGADNKCHDYPPQVVIKENTFLPAAIVFGAALITAAYIFRGGHNPFKKKG